MVQGKERATQEEGRAEREQTMNSSWLLFSNKVQFSSALRGMTSLGNTDQDCDIKVDNRLYFNSVE